MKTRQVAAAVVASPDPIDETVEAAPASMRKTQVRPPLRELPDNQRKVEEMLSAALTINPDFHPIYAPVAQETLLSLRSP